MERTHKPSALPMSPSLPQPVVDIQGPVVTARLPTKESVTVNLYGATVTSWTLADGEEQLFLSKAAKLDGSKPIRGGVPLVFPVFGPPPSDHATSRLPQHGFARSTSWEFLGKSTSESLPSSQNSDNTIKLDFGLSPDMLSPDSRSAWPFPFALVYSVTLSPKSLELSLHVQNKSDQSFEFQALLHSYLSVLDIQTTTLTLPTPSPYIDKTQKAQTFTQDTPTLQLTGETDRVYTGLPADIPITINDARNPRFSIEDRNGFPDATVWNLWEDKAKAMADFEPKDGWKRYVCVEPGAVSGWTKLEAGDAWEGGCVMRRL
ncbi:MAG: hypothetical protein Q9227_000650 [Pyrenula ochraceoflavens]